MKRNAFIFLYLIIGIGLSLTVSCKKEVKTQPLKPIYGEDIKDIEGNSYHTVIIDSQVWMAENLRTSRYNNGDTIATTYPANKNIMFDPIQKYQWAYKGDSSYDTIYGRLYTWYAITDSRQVCPTGYHIPNKSEWDQLTTFLGGPYEAGSKIKETDTIHWLAPNSDATNEVGFTALPGGSRGYLGDFGGLRKGVAFWCSDTVDSQQAWVKFISQEFFVFNPDHKSDGLSVRCLKN